MDETTFQTAGSFLKKSEKVLIALPLDLTVDAAAAALGLEAVLSALGKSVVVASTRSVPGRLSFLPNSVAVQPIPTTTTQLVVSLDTTHAQLGELSYDTLPGKVNIYLRAKDGQFSEQDVAVSRGKPAFDLIVVLGAEAPEQLGTTFTDHTELFYSLPRINMDINPRNDNHGTINVIDVTVSSISELVYRLLTRISEEHVPLAATALLAGILAYTDSLKNQRTTPDTFAVVADLIAAGADYTAVVKYLFKTERLGFLKLWGRSLARLKVLPDRGVGYSILLSADFEKTGEQTSSAKDLVAELHKNVGELSTIALAVPDGEQSRVYILHSSQLVTDQLISILGGTDPEFFRLDFGLSGFSTVVPKPVSQVEAGLVAAFESAIPPLT